MAARERTAGVVECAVLQNFVDLAVAVQIAAQALMVRAVTEPNRTVVQLAIDAN